MPLNLTEDELQLLAALPQSIGSAVAFAGRSGLFGTGKEMFASGQALMAGAKDCPGNELTRPSCPTLPPPTNRPSWIRRARRAIGRWRA